MNEREEYPPILVWVECCREWRVTRPGDLDITDCCEGAEGQDRITWLCGRCGGEHTSDVRKV